MYPARRAVVHRVSGERCTCGCWRREVRNSSNHSCAFLFPEYGRGLRALVESSPNPSREVAFKALPARSSIAFRESPAARFARFALDFDDRRASQGNLAKKNFGDARTRPRTVARARGKRKSHARCARNSVRKILQSAETLYSCGFLHLDQIRVVIAKFSRDEGG
jgi:hypothetical protein